MKSHPAHIVRTWQLIFVVTGFLTVLLLTTCQIEPDNLIATAVPTIAVVPTSTTETATTTEPQAELAQTLQNILDQAVIDGASGAVLLVDAPDLDFAWKSAAGQSMAADEPFLMAGGVEMVTAVTLLKLCEQSQLNLEDPISLYLPADLVNRLLVVNGKSLGETITIHQLLNHTSGLGDFAADGIAPGPPVGKPGETFHHSRANIWLAGLIIEKVSGLPLPDAYRQFIFEPLGMAHTYFALDKEAGWQKGRLVSTLEDQNRFLRTWANDELFDNPACQGIMSNWIQTDDAGRYYGLGMQRFILDEWDFPGLGQLIGYGGQFNSLAFYWPEQNVTIIGTLNSNEPPFGFASMMLDVMLAIQEYANKRFIMEDGRC
ncbi:MAG: beta-lactamase family protein [Ardenticatenaceae bacterium]|nr:beta-lactamase family protein [Ardenticatenaceae bacterium]MCB9444486.1 beta-lactamase family protein [Ardenticatenaceae bacterium]